VVAILILVGLGVAGMLRVDPSFDIELLFPETDPAREDYDRFKAAFPQEDAGALVLIESESLFTTEGLRRVAALEKDLLGLPGVESTDSLVSLQDVVDDEGELSVEVLFPSLAEGTPSPDELEEGKTRATQDPLFAWRLAHPAGKATTLRVRLEPKRPGDSPQARKRILSERVAFLAAARSLLAEHEEAAAGELHLTLTGMPVVRAEYIELINADTLTLFPVALLVVGLLLFVAFPHPGDVAATVLTLGAAALWTQGAMGALGYPLHPLTNVTPIVVLIISVSDSVHIISHYREFLARGVERSEAIAAATAESAVPCLLTEIAIAGGFMGLLGADMLMIQQFGVVTAVGVLLAWLANMIVLPLALLAFGARSVKATPGQGSSRAEGWLRRFTSWVEVQIAQRPGRVYALAAAITLTALVLGYRVGREYYNFDDLRAGSPILAELAAAERIHGGVVPLVVFLEPTGESAELAEPMLDPRFLALMDRIEERLEELPEMQSASSPATVLRKAHRLLLGAEDTATAPLPDSRAGIAQELLFIDDGQLFEDTLTVDRSVACVVGTMPDTGSTRAREVIAELNAFLATETAGLPIKATITGNYVIADAVYRALVGGLFKSLGVAIAITFLIFCFVLRSWRLALIGLVPNLLPLALTLGVMSLLGIDLKVSTVIVFSITLVIADDDTIQYLARFRRRLDELFAEGHADPTGQAALDVLRSTGAPMLVTTLAVSLGFLTLLGSRFLGIAHLGLLIGVSLFAAVFADLFLTPLLIRTIRPRVGGGPRGAAEASPAPSAEP
jgi:predicted RND superfamily exporter protein